MVIKFEDLPRGGDARPFRVFVGRIVHSGGPAALEILPQGALGVHPDGTIAFLKAFRSSLKPVDEVLEEFCHAEIIYLEPSQFLMPGMVDTHLHAPQWPNLGLGMEGRLKEWVEKWTNPVEARSSCTCLLIDALTQTRPPTATTRRPVEFMLTS